MKVRSIMQLMFETPNAGGSGGGTPSVPAATSSTSSTGTPAAPAAPTSATSALENASTRLGAESLTAPTGTPAVPPTGEKPVVPAATSTPAAPATTVNPGDNTPESRIQAAVRNARQELIDRVGWAQDLDRNEVNEAVQMLRDLSANPQDFLRRLQAEVHQEEPETDPEPDFVSADGRKKAYSDLSVQKMLANLEKRLTRQFSQQLAPVAEFTTQARTQQAVQARVAAARATGAKALAEARELPHFKENEEHIVAALEAMDPNYRRQVGTIAALNMAYNRVMATRVLPMLRQTTEAEVIAGFNKSANASSGSVNPQTGTGGAPALKDGDIDGLAKHLERLSGGVAV